MNFDEWWNKEGLLCFGSGTEQDAREIWNAAQSAEREAMKPAIIAACNAHTREMEGYSYFGSNPGVCEDDYEDVANEAAAIRARGQK